MRANVHPVRMPDRESDRLDRQEPLTWLMAAPSIEPR